MTDHTELRKSLRYQIAECERAALATNRRLQTLLHQRADLVARLAALDGVALDSTTAEAPALAAVEVPNG